MSERVLHLIEDLLAGAVAVLIGMCACFAMARAYPAVEPLSDVRMGEADVSSLPRAERAVLAPAERLPESIDEPVSLGVFKLTAYCACEKCCGEYADGITATGTTATEGRTIAVDPTIIPYGTRVIINGHEYVAEDCGGGIKGDRIDVFFASHEDALLFGVGEAEVFVCGQ